VTRSFLERTDAIAEGQRGGIDGWCLLNFGDEGGADDGGVGQPPKNGNMARQRNPEADGNGKPRDGAGPPKEGGEIVRQGILRASDAGARIR